jgi:cytidylate kinase
LRDRGQRAIYAEILRDMKERDERDSRRTVAPMRPAADAVVIDTSDLDADRAFAQALAIVEDRAGRR